MTTKLTIGDWAYIFGFAAIIIWVIYASKKERELASNQSSSTGSQQS